MGVFEKGGEFFIDYYYIDEEGRRRRRQEKVGTNRRLAEDLLGKRRMEVREGKLLDKKKEERVRLFSLTDWYLEKYSARKRSGRDDCGKVGIARTYFGDVLVRDITPSKVEDFLHYVRKERGTTVATANRYLALLKHLFTKAVQEGLISANPAQYVRKEREDNARDRIVEPDEYERLKAVAAPHLRRIIVAAHETGMREGEILELRWRQINSKTGIINLSPEDTKTKYKRYIPITDEMERVLGEIPRRIDHDYVFTGPDGMPIKRFKTAWRTALRHAGIEGLRFHDFRHTCTTRWRRAGVDLLTIMAMTGHKTMATFARYNTFIVDDLKRAAAQVRVYEAQKRGDFLETEHEAQG